MRKIARTIVQMLAGFLAILSLISCSALQKQMGNASLDSYLQGCIYRGIEEGITRSSAKELCQCHVELAIKQSSQEMFLDATSRLAKASKAERQSGALSKEITLVGGSFKQCKATLEL